MSKELGSGTAPSVPPLQKNLFDRIAQPGKAQTVVSKLLQENTENEKQIEKDQIKELENRLRETEEKLSKAQNKIEFQARCVEELKTVLRTEGTQKKGERYSMPWTGWRLFPVIFVTGAVVLLIEHGIGIWGLLGIL
ncbi:MAG: hypothetical protein HFE83_05340 [Lachnospiraceae bacterium]|nr:hypothetical protein [Lachnospiraceae bacterium]